MNRRTWIQHIGLGSLAIIASGRLWALEKITRSDNEWEQQLSEAAVLYSPGRGHRASRLKPAK